MLFVFVFVFIFLFIWIDLKESFQKKMFLTFITLFPHMFCFGGVTDIDSGVIFHCHIESIKLTHVPRYLA